MRLPSRSRSAMILVAIASAFVTIVSLATPARADSSIETAWGYAHFYSYGDKFKVCDDKTDYWGVGVRYSYIQKDGDTQRGSHWNTSGAGTCRTFDHNFGEGRTVWYQLCLKDGPVVLECTAVRTDTA
jgi:hypothetical protein